MREYGAWKGMRELVLLCLFLSVSCAAEEGGTLSEREKAMRVAESTAFYYDSKGTPAEFAANRYLRLVNERRVLLKQKVLTEGEAVRRLAEYYDDVQLGRNWKVKREVLQIPELPCAPSLDADFRRGGWSDARVINGEYVLNQTEKSAFSSRWFLGWHEDALYVGAQFPDSEIVARNGRNCDNGGNLYEGDCLEVFIRPEPGKKEYFEFLVNPDGVLWMLRHSLDRWGRNVVADADMDPETVRCHARRNKDGYRIALRIPFGIFHGKWCRKTSCRGEVFELMLVRTNRGKERYGRSAFVPLLYDGHNLFCYAKGIFAVKK